MAKLIENTYRLVNISLMNEVALLAESGNIDIWESIDAAATKPFGYQPFYPGHGAGGHCIPEDPNFLLNVTESNTAMPILNSSLQLNDRMPLLVTRLLADALPQSGSVLVCGLAYKPNTGDIRNSTALNVAEKLTLIYDTRYSIQAIDPHVSADDVSVDVSTEPLSTAVQDADAVVYLVDHDAFDKRALFESATQVFDVTGSLPNADWQFGGTL
jgi:UDP-N-acetyl-D-glucosamine dehydrogenase